ncbi:MAG: MOSC domain-containing protein [Planctomycetes bacterium]|nr:MOSC domain-containing protein [Planctomycetota bacterium]
MPTLLSINVSSGGIPKTPTPSCAVSFKGLAGDGRNHEKHYKLERAVSLIDTEILEQLKTEGYNVPAGAVGENLTVENLDVQSLQLGDRLTFSGGVVIELAEVRKPCFVLDPLGVSLKKDIVGRCGYLARVITEGTLKSGESIVVQPVTP